TPEVLMHVGGVQNGVGLLVHEACSYSAGCGWDRGSAPFSFPPSQRDSRWLPSTRPPGRKTTMSTKSRPSVRCQPSPTNLESTVTSGCSTPSGRNDRKLRSTLVLIAEKMFSKYLISHAPTTGPNSVPTPPRMVIRTTFPDSVHFMRSAPASGSVTDRSAPAKPANMPEMTKAARV